MEEGLGFRFYAMLAGLVIAGGIIALLVIAIISRAWWAWGFFGAFAVLAAALLIFGWTYDRRQARDI